MPGLILRMLITAAGLWLASEIVPSIVFQSGSTLFAAAILLGVVNAVVRPIAILLTLPITILSLGLFILFINAAMLNLVAWLLEGLSVGGWGSALIGALIVSITSWAASWYIGSNGRYEVWVVEDRRTGV
jgi:putative membrane protein